MLAEAFKIFPWVPLVIKIFYLSIRWRYFVIDNSVLLCGNNEKILFVDIRDMLFSLGCSGLLEKLSSWVMMIPKRFNLGTVVTLFFRYKEKNN